MSSLPRPTPSRLFVGLAGVILITTGCGGSGGGKTAPSTAPSVATTAAPPGQPQLAGVVVQQSDLPGGWAARKAGVSVADVTDATAFAQCMGTPNTTGDIVAIASSNGFISGSSVITSIATSFKSRADVQADATALVDPKAASCLLQVGKTHLSALLPAGATVKSYTVKVTPGANGGPQNEVATATASITYSTHGKSTTIVNDTVYLLAPRIEAHINFITTGKAIDDQVKAAVIDHVSARVHIGS